jgi:hypothetical protein
MSKRWAANSLIALIALLLAACGELSPFIQEQLSEIDLPQLFATATPLPPPTPVGDTLSFQIPQQRYGETIRPNNFIPGTQLQFLGKEDERFLLRIDGLDSVKQAGDRLVWQGVMAPNVLGNFDLYLSPTFGRDILLANGQVTLTVFNPAPFEAEPPLSNTPPFIFQNVDLYYVVPQGRAVPGTSLIYLGFVGEEVEFGGTSTYPRYRVGESLRWTGLLRENVYITNDMRIEQVTERGVVLRGSAEMRVYQTLP